MKKYIPQRAKLKYQLYKRYWREHIQNHHLFASKQYVKHTHSNVIFPFQISTEQQIKASSFFENKTANIDLCIQYIDGLIVPPNHIFSFWHLVPEPSIQNGFKQGRNIINGAIGEEIGGGICQVSCILYITALKAGLKIIERHAHSVDIYQEHERFTPLGSDATIVYAYKDLQFKNIFDFPIQINLRRKHDVLIAQFSFQNKILEKNIHFSVELRDQIKYVITHSDLDQINLSIYKVL
ncbi:VanW family protein [Acinetobacter shaoyimingii]|uniref:VanW family protein n=1 Tax=Acinetobacter shaoyimingii TaxID=2715164 RepID=A0A6G8RRQ8_9GAMM|nr:VanW family protein [Acinetobacter shaoyimingii]QIO04606.1 VanW family protein [Acinetobacter shaoyimingii]